MALEIKQMGYADIEKRIAEMPKDPKGLSLEQLERNTKELIALEERRAEIKKNVEERQKILDRVTNAGPNDLEVRTIASTNDIKHMGENTMEREKRNQENKQDLEIRALQKYVTKLELNEEEKRSLDSVGAAVMIPKHAVNELITDTKYSDLLHRATVFNETNRGETNVPISTSTSATWKTENEEQTPANGEITSIKLYGYELMRLLSISAAADSLSQVDFKRLLLDLISSEVIETLEQSFITGTGASANQPEGLQALDFVADTNMIETAELTADDVVSALSLLPQKYARKAVILANSKNLFKLNKFVAENDNTLSSGADTFLKREIVPNEHLADNEIYIVDPKQLYVKFAQPLQVEADRSSGFRRAAIDLRALAVVDAKWNKNAVVKVSVTA